MSAKMEEGYSTNDAATSTSDAGLSKTKSVEQQKESPSHHRDDADEKISLTMATSASDERKEKEADPHKVQSRGHEQSSHEHSPSEIESIMPKNNQDRNINRDDRNLLNSGAPKVASVSPSPSTSLPRQAPTHLQLSGSLKDACNYTKNPSDPPKVMVAPTLADSSPSPSDYDSTNQALQTENGISQSKRSPEEKEEAPSKTNLPEIVVHPSTSTSTSTTSPSDSQKNHQSSTLTSTLLESSSTKMALKCSQTAILATPEENNIKPPSLLEQTRTSIISQSVSSRPSPTDPPQRTGESQGRLISRVMIEEDRAFLHLFDDSDPPPLSSRMITTAASAAAATTATATDPFPSDGQNDHHQATSQISRPPLSPQKNPGQCSPEDDDAAVAKPPPFSSDSQAQRNVAQCVAIQSSRGRGDRGVRSRSNDAGRWQRSDENDNGNEGEPMKIQPTSKVQQRSSSSSGSPHINIIASKPAAQVVVPSPPNSPRQNDQRRPRPLRSSSSPSSANHLPQIAPEVNVVDPSPASKKVTRSSQRIATSSKSSSRGGMSAASTIPATKKSTSPRRSSSRVTVHSSSSKRSSSRFSHESQLSHPTPTSSKKRPHSNPDYSENSVELGEVGYTFEKYFPLHGLFRGKVEKLVGDKKELRRCVYTDGDSEDLTVAELSVLSPRQKKRRQRQMSQRYPFPPAV